MATTRQTVIDAARTRLNAGESIQISALVEATGVSVGSMYHHFESKSGIWDAVEGEAFMRYIEGVRGRLLNDLSRGRDGSVRRGKRGRRIFEESILDFHKTFFRLSKDRFKVLAHGSRKSRIAYHLSDLIPKEVEDPDMYIANLLGPLFFYSGADKGMVSEAAIQALG